MNLVNTCVKCGQTRGSGPCPEATSTDASHVFIKVCYPGSKSIATGEALAASPEEWDESQTEEYIPTLYDPIITAAYNDNDGKGVYYVARWKTVANGLLADGETREEAVRSLLDATATWLEVFMATERKSSAVSPEWSVWIKGCNVGVLSYFVCDSIDGDDCFGPFDERQAERLCEALNRPTPNSAARQAELLVISTSQAIDLKAEIRALREALANVTEDLEAEIEHRYARTKDHPAMRDRYDRDMESVIEARTVLAEGSTDEQS